MSLFTSFDAFEEIVPDAMDHRKRVVVQPRVVVSTSHVGIVRTGHDAEMCMMRLQNSQVTQPPTAYLEYGTGQTVWDHGSGRILAPPPEAIEAPRHRFYRGHYSPPSPVPFFGGHPDQDEDARDISGASWICRVVEGGESGGVKSIFPVNEVHAVAPDYQTSYTCEMEVHRVVPVSGRPHSLQRVRAADATLVETATFSNLPYMLIRNLLHHTRQDPQQEDGPLAVDTRRVHVNMAAGSSGRGRWAVLSPTLLLAANVRHEMAGHAPAPEYLSNSCLRYTDAKHMNVDATSPTKSKSPTRKSPSTSGRSTLKSNPSTPQATAALKSHPYVDDGVAEYTDVLAKKSTTQFITMLSLREGVAGGSSIPRSTSPTKRLHSGVNSAATALSLFCSQSGMMPLESDIVQIYNRTPTMQYHRLSPSGMLLSPMQLDALSATELVHRCAESLVDYLRFVEEAPVDHIIATKLVRRLLTATVNIPEHVDDRDRSVVQFFNHLTGRAQTPSPIHGGRLAIKPLDLGIPSVRAHRSSATLAESKTVWEAKYVPTDVDHLTELVKDSGPTMPSTNPRPIVSYLEAYKERLYDGVAADALVGNVVRKVLSLVSECQLQKKHPLVVFASHLAHLSKRGVSASLSQVVRALSTDTTPQYLACIEHPLHFLYPHLDGLMGSGALLGNVRGGSITERSVPSKKKVLSSKQSKVFKRKDARNLQNQFYGSDVVWEPSGTPDEQDVLRHEIWLQETYLPASDEADKSASGPVIISGIAQGILREACFNFFPHLYHSPALAGAPLSIVCPTPAQDTSGVNVLPSACLGGILQTVGYSFQCSRSTVTPYRDNSSQGGTRHPLIDHLLSLTERRPDSVSDVLLKKASVAKPVKSSKKRPATESGKLPILVEHLPSFPPKPPAPQFLLGDLPSPFDSFYEDAAGLLPRDAGYYERVLAGSTSGGFGCHSPTPSVDRLKVPAGLAPSSLGGWGPQTIQSLLFPRVGSNSVAPPPSPTASPLHPSLDTYRQNLVNHFQRQPEEVDIITYAQHLAATVHYYIGIILSAGGVPSTATLRRNPPTRQPHHVSQVVVSALRDGMHNSSLNGTASSKCGHLGDTVTGSTGLTPQELINKLRSARSEGRKEVTILTRQEETGGESDHSTLLRVKVGDQELFTNQAAHENDEDLVEDVLRNYGYPPGAVWPTPSAVSLSTAGVTGGKLNDAFTALIPNAKEHTRVMKILLGDGEHLSVSDADFSICTDQHSPALVEASKQAAVLQLHHEYRLLLARCLFTLILGDGSGPTVVVTPGREVAQATCPDGPPQYNVSYSYQYAPERVGELMQFPIICRKETTFSNTYDRHRNALYSHVFGPSSVALACGGSRKEIMPVATEEDVRYVEKVVPSLLKKTPIEENGPPYLEWWKHFYDYVELCTGQPLLEYQSDTVVVSPTDFTVVDEPSLVDVDEGPISQLKTGRITETDWLLARPPLVQVLLGISLKRSATPVATTLTSQQVETPSRSPSPSQSGSITPRVSDVKESSSVELESSVVADHRYFPSSLFGMLPGGGGTPSYPPLPTTGVLQNVKLTPCTASVGVLRQDLTYEVLSGGKVRLVDIGHAPLPNAVVDINRRLPISLGATSLMYFTLNSGCSQHVRYWMPPSVPPLAPVSQSRRRWGPSSIKSLIAALDADQNEYTPEGKTVTARSGFDEALGEVIHKGLANQVATFDVEYHK